MAKLTNKIIENTQPAQKDVYLWDSALPGFGVKITPKGRKVFIVRYRNESKKSRYITLGRCIDTDLNEARKRAKVIFSSVSAGNDPADEKRLQLEKPTMQDLYIRYMREHAIKKKLGSRRNDKILWEKHILKNLSQRKVDSITMADVIALQNNMIETPFNANRAFEVLRKALNLAEMWQMRPDNTNPCRHVKKLPEKTKTRILTPEELKSLPVKLSEAERLNITGCEYVPLIKLMLFTGMRPGEWLNGRWEWIDFNRGLYHLPDSKTGQRTITLSNLAIDMLKSMNPYTEGCIFPAQRNKNKPRAFIHRRWSVLRAFLGLEGVRLYDLRHTVGSYAHMAGLSQKQVAGLLGHNQLSTTERYIHALNDQAQQTANIAAEGIFNLTNQDN